MTYSIELHPLAQQELEESYRWYEERAEGLGLRFLTAVEKSFAKIALMPDAYAKRKNNFREIVLKDFPFVIVFEVLKKQEIIIISYVFHAKRSPKLKYRKRQ